MKTQNIVLIGAGIVAAGLLVNYYMKKKNSESFSNAIDAGPKPKKAPKWCEKACPQGFPVMLNGECHCFSWRQIRTPQFKNAVSSAMMASGNKPCKHTAICHEGQKWNEKTCRCEKTGN